MRGRLRSVLFAGMAAALLGGAALPAPLAPADRTAILGRVPAPASASDDALWSALLDHARTELGQRLRPSEVDRMWAIQPLRRDVAAEAAAARRDGRLTGWLDQLSPPAPQYRALLALRQRYAALAAAPWPWIPAGPLLREGEAADVVPILRRRLEAEGYLVDAGAADQLDAPLAAALRRFQRQHAIAADGVLGPETRAALNVTAAERVSQIDANLERWRWLPRALPADRFEVDIAGMDGTLFRNARPVLAMRVIVGHPRTRTPMFASRIEAVVLNPPWNVPDSIARNEILPLLRRDPGYLARNNFVSTGGRLVQKPGPQSALGVVKFDLPSPFGVYLHDTPGKAAFRLTNRTLSHGCMRLEKPRELAAALLAPDAVTATELERIIASGETTRVPLQRPLPLFVLYRTVIVDEAGEPTFRRDVYGWDAKLSAALAGLAPSVAAAATATDCAETRATAAPPAP